jgi:N4-(beta-N-acetylglucosaminyl)-L-asparaginase
MHGSQSRHEQGTIFQRCKIKMSQAAFSVFSLVLWPAIVHCQLLPVVINTWPFVSANYKAAEVVMMHGSHLDAVEMGCSECEIQQCDGTVGYGGSPNEAGETTLDAMIMDGVSHDVGAVGCLKSVKQAISVARSVMEHTQETLLVGEDATNFALKMGFEKQDLHTNKSREEYQQWEENNCQPNYWKPGTVSPDPSKSCGPYKPEELPNEHNLNRPPIDSSNHDTIGMIAIDALGRIACGTSTNGASHKIPGRVGDSPIAGAGCYVDKEVGGAAGTGDGDIMMRFLPAYHAVENMRQGMSPMAAAEEALNRIKPYYPTFSGALITLNMTGHYGAANYGFSSFKYTVFNPELKNSTVISV